MFNWLRNASGRPRPIGKREHVSEPEFRPAKLPPRRDEKTSPPPAWGLRAVPGAIVSQNRDTGQIVYNLLTPHMQQFMGRCVGAIKRAGIRAKGTGQFSVLVGEQNVEIHLSNFYQPGDDPLLVERVVAKATNITNSEGAKDTLSDVVMRLCQHIVQRRQKMIVDNNQTELVWSDGAILEAGASFPSGLQALISQPTDHRDIRSSIKQLNADATGWRDGSEAPSARSEELVTISSLDETVTTCVESLYMEYLGQRYPAAGIRLAPSYSRYLF